MAYEHTQRGWFHWVIYGVVVLVAIGGWSVRSEGWPAFLLWGVGALVAVLALSFHFLTVREDGAHLSLRFGPLPLLRKRIPYELIRSVRVSRSKLIDGWGIHWVPGRGWTYNLCGFDCVELELDGGKRARIGTDDTAGLLAHLQGRIAQRTD